MDPSFRALSGRLKCAVQRHKFNEDSLSLFVCLFVGWLVGWLVELVSASWAGSYQGRIIQSTPGITPRQSKRCNRGGRERGRTCTSVGLTHPTCAIALRSRSSSGTASNPVCAPASQPASPAVSSVSLHRRCHTVDRYFLKRGLGSQPAVPTTKEAPG